MAVLPQNVRARDGRMPAQDHFDCRSEPSKVKPAVLGYQKSRFRKVHLASHVLHPLLRPWFPQHADRGGITRKWTIGERIDLDDSNGHDSYRLAQAETKTG